MANKTFSESAQAFAVKQALKMLRQPPEECLPKLIEWAKRFDTDGMLTSQIHGVEAVLNDPTWSKFIKSLWDDIDEGVRMKIFENFIINSALIGMPRQQKVKDEHGCSVPWAILMDPTSACNLHCTGCWAAEYGNKLNLTYEEMDSIVNQANEMGTYMFLFTGGEPMVRKKDIIRLCEAHNDCVFSAFTNGTLIDEEFADEMLRVKNFVPAISVEGFEEATDDRRGHGTYAAVVRAMEILKRKKLPFGISCCYTSKNYDVIGSEEYFDDMIAKGAKFAWLFTYMPVGKNAVPELMVTAEQRAYMYRKVREFRHTKPLFTMDFWNDGEYAGDAGATATSTPPATLSRARSSTTPTRTSARRRCWRPTSPRFSWPTTEGSRSTATICAPARCWITPARWRTWCTSPAPGAPTWRRPRTSTSLPPSALTRRKSGPSSPPSSGARATPTAEPHDSRRSEPPSAGRGFVFLLSPGAPAPPHAATAAWRTWLTMGAALVSPPPACSTSTTKA